MFQFTSLVSNPFASRSTPPESPPEPPVVSEEAATAPDPFPFLRLPLELREQIYSVYFSPADHLVKSTELEAKGFFGGVYQWDFDVLRVNKQVYEEAKKVWRRENVFVKVATPWPSAVNHISSEGLVPIVCTDARADAFTSYHAVVQITAPFHGVVPEHMVVMLVDDLHLFTKTWYYSALSYPMLNERLSTTFVLRNPYAEYNDEEERTSEAQEEQEGLGIPISLQRKLLLPFEHVKGLHGTSIHGYSPAVRKELARLQAKPVPTLRESVESATDFMLAGDAALASSSNADTNSKDDPDAEAANREAALQALELYRKAFHAIHILIHGRTRRVLADDFFHDSITSGRYAGQTGITIRVVLRLKLVSRTVAAYNKLGQWGEAAFWGFRTVQILQESFNTDFEHFLTDFIEGSDSGLIYVRAGIAFWHMEKDKEAWLGELISYADEPVAESGRLWAAARRFVKPAARADVRKELQDHGVPQTMINLFSDVATREEAVESTVADDGSSTSEE
ncbi:hypothetical protein AA0111_g5958 [Alternaria arborescens]|uniref:hypothetical protein n=1 Tax=Alternaria arborescens TaxID=156630 RepID=UPI001074B796|nr:hypothetical protein AA0111_g5958 [Alternaria arborescens]RYO29749.1 hypothetical protein AA0111_g5958 [Alternaria arborescens]